MTKAEFLKVKKLIEAYWVNSNVFTSDEVVKAWYERFKDFEVVKLEAALGQMVDRYKYAPSISDIKAVYYQVTRVADVARFMTDDERAPDEVIDEAVRQIKEAIANIERVKPNAKRRSDKGSGEAI